MRWQPHQLGSPVGQLQGQKHTVMAPLRPILMGQPATAATLRPPCCLRCTVRALWRRHPRCGAVCLMSQPPSQQEPDCWQAPGVQLMMRQPLLGLATSAVRLLGQVLAAQLRLLQDQPAGASFPCPGLGSLLLRAPGQG